MVEEMLYTAFGTRNVNSSFSNQVGVDRSTVKRVAEALLPTEFGEFRIIGYRSLISDEEFVVLARGDLRAEKPTLVRIHSQCLTGDVFGSTRCDCGQQLRAAMKLIAKEGCGVIIYQQQEGRGIGIINKIRAYALQDGGADTIEANERLGFEVDLRRYEQCAEILRDLGLRRVRLISNNPEKIRVLKNNGLEIVERVALSVKVYRSLARYLGTKRSRMGHLINAPEPCRKNVKVPIRAPCESRDESLRVDAVATPARGNT
jgi:3,4-dihydroxy 2-butanone 4-phosphate synthase/GTP cyclohydrolase II